MPTSTATPIPYFVWESGFENGFAGWTVAPQRKGAGVETIPDPTGSGRGNVMRAWIEGPFPALEPDDPLYYKRRGYPAVWFALKPFPCSMQEDVWVSRDFGEQATKSGNWYTLIGFFDAHPIDGGTYHYAGGTSLRNDLYLGLDIKDVVGSSNRFPPTLRNAPRFSFETWHTVKLVADTDGKVYLYQDEALVSTGQYAATTRKGTVGGHGGLYVGHDVKFPTGDFTSGFIYTDNFKIACWK